jgi:uracil-DNA glycosylase
LPPQWRALLASEAAAPYFKKLSQFLNSEYRKGAVVYPERKNILRAIQSLDYDDVKVVILGQDPYHGKGQAIGLSFAVPNSLAQKPPSLINIFKEIEADLNTKVLREKSDLTGWVQQGVLLLNTVLTVKANAAFSHRDQGWEIFTDKIISALNERKQPVIFLLWGSPAQKKSHLITNKKHFILTAPHPSPLSAHRGFMGCKHFSKANSILVEKLNLPGIHWSHTSE